MGFLYQLTKKEYIVFFSFLIGYLFALTSDDTNLYTILSLISPLSLVISNLFYFLLLFLIYIFLIKKYKYLLIKKINKKEVLLGVLKNMFLGYFLGIITLIGNVFIKVVM